MIITEAEFSDFMSWLAYQDEIAIDTETTGLDAYARPDGAEPARICGVSVMGHDGNSAYLPFRHGMGYNMPLNRLHDLTGLLSQRVQRGELNLMLWNAKFDLHMLAADGFVPGLKGGVEDFMLGAHLLNENEPSFGLKEYSDKYGFGRGSLDENELKEKIESRFGKSEGKGWKGKMWRLPAEDVAPYAETDVILTRLAALAQRPALEQWNLANLYAEVNDYMLLLWRSERRGVKLDRARIAEQMEKIGPTRLHVFDEIIAFVRQRTGSDLNPIIEPDRFGAKGQVLKKKERLTFNPNSVPQLQAVTGWEGTDVKFLEGLEVDDPLKGFAELVLDYRVASKMSGTYYDAYLSKLDEYDVLRPNYNLHGTVNGRLSGSNPNLQNVPRFTERRPVKNVFIARDGYVLVEMDYEQAELRIATHYAKESRMRDVFLAGEDPHGATATKLGIPRFVAKTLNFLIIYGGGVRAVVKTLKCDEATAKAYLRGYHNLYTQFSVFSKAMEGLAIRDGYIRMPTGRIRHFNSWKRYRWEAEPRKAMNSYVQGTASEMLRIGMMRLDDEIRQQQIDAHMLLQVHDSLLLEVRPHELPRLVPLMQRVMTGFGFDPAPAIEIKSGAQWAPMEVIAK